MGAQPRIKRLCISRFRGISTLEWCPSNGINVLIGGGDSGKSTLLHAISLLFSPTNSVQVLETDYLNRVSADGFSIEAVVSLPPQIGIADYNQMLWPWEWNGKQAVVPDPEADGGKENPVYKFRVRGTDGLEAVWEIIQPDEVVIPLSVSLRRKIGVVRLTSDDRNDRDLRLVSGSALDRLISQGNLKARINQAASAVDFSDALTAKEAEALTTLGTLLEKAALPHDLRLGLTSSQGLSIGALIGLLADNRGVMLPLASWGAGTRRMSALEIASATEAATHLTVIDEIERGLEPYRLRQLIGKLKNGDSQCYITTHSPVAISCAGDSALWYMDATGRIGPLDRVKIAEQLKRDPETFLARLAVIAEGVTEVGFLKFILRNAFNASHGTYGIRISDGGGNEAMLGLLEALNTGGLEFAGFCDDEGKFPERWKRIKDKIGPLQFQWKTGCLEENVIKHVSDRNLFSLAVERDGTSGRRMRTIADRLGIKDKGEASILAACALRGDQYAVLRTIITEAATGSKVGAPDEDTAKEWGKHARVWFKSERGGGELAEKMSNLDLWSKLEPEVLPFLNALRAHVGHAALAEGQLHL
jgi:putative ATP-dependent endonuclease of OLD family